MSVGKICSRIVYTARPDETVVEAARRMKEHGVGSLVVLDEDRRPMGILTDRDVAMRCVAEGIDAEATEVRDVMSLPVTAMDEDAPIESALQSMAATSTRREPVVDDQGKLVGLLALDDVLSLLVEEAESIGKLLHSQTPH
ncbi:MAG: CBS domain-containing protein [Gemmatimonadota bacterium]|nr:CBS domain-containing protein [Gemmatimonadota bacterium]